jgi:hypothetical protein
MNDVALPDGVGAPSLAQCYRGIDAVAGAKEELEPHLYRRLTDLTNLDLRLLLRPDLHLLRDRPGDE